jgi:hypothetical protein
MLWTYGRREALLERNANCVSLSAGVVGSKCFLINGKFEDHLKYLMIDISHSKNLSPHTAAIIPADTTDKRLARKGIPPNNAKLPARTTPNMNLSSMVTVPIISSHDGLMSKCQNLQKVAEPQS